MTSEFTQSIAEKLRERKQQLEAELGQIATKRSPDGVERGMPFGDMGRSEDENAAGVAVYSDNLSLERTLDKELRDVTNALSRLESGKYGTCRYCEKLIDEKRLLARPTSSACVSCKMELQKQRVA